MNSLEDKKIEFFSIMNNFFYDKKSLYINPPIRKIGLFKKLFISYSSREINGEKENFIIIHDIELYPEFRGQKFFEELIEFCKNAGQKIWVDDIINNKLFSFLSNKGFKPIIYKSQIGYTSCMYKR